MNFVVPDEKVQQGIQVLLDDYVLVENTDTFVIAYTPDSRDPAAWLALALKHRGFPARIVAMRKLQDPEFAGRFEAALPDPETLPGRLVVLALERDTMSHFNVFEAALKKYGGDRTMIMRIISASSAFFTKSLNVTPTQLSRFNATLLERVKPARKVRVTSRGGTDLTIGLDAEKYHWISNRGVWRPGGFTILPAGEIATYPTTVDGVLVADGAFNANIITSLNADLAGNPVRVEIKNGSAVSLSCADRELDEMFQLCLNSPYGRNVGEFGLGTNRGIDTFITANSHINERRCGVHIGLGQHNQRLSRVPYVADVHLDLITDGALIWVDDDPDPIDLESFAVTDAEHPADALDEDITGDCCGLGYGQLEGLASCATPGAPVRIQR
ncbi:M29 family metallopeptidase [Streptomyces beihaiensis]|uniref:Aminopeptidase n=1 Tax=Streptomyces beihaiensis TaxID=2984495 RepID=A0ABT3TTE9_9ACTN|nr:aminopeptidase [Streptomyces beihaiensis]MCX3060304.1 aminopeptidase [Streptomyces beihaiensis]